MRTLKRSRFRPRFTKARRAKLFAIRIDTSREAMRSLDQKAYWANAAQRLSNEDYRDFQIQIARVLLAKDRATRIDAAHNLRRLILNQRESGLDLRGVVVDTAPTFGTLEL